MTALDPELVLGKLKLHNPPSHLSLLREVDSLEWRCETHQNIDTYSEILLRISADVIICGFDAKKSDIEIQKSIFHSIRNKISSSNLLKSTDFLVYFRKFEFYINEL